MAQRGDLRMKNSFQRFIISLMFLLLTAPLAQAGESSLSLEKIKSFFVTPEETAKPESKPSTAVSPAKKAESKPQEPAAPKKPVYDFSEKTIGNRNAPIKIHIFTSLTCPHCPVVHAQVSPYLERKYVQNNEAILILTDFPLEARAVVGSLISRCLTGDKYFAFMDSLFENQLKWAVAPNLHEALLPYAKLAGLTEEEMTACANDEAGLKELTRQRNLALMQFRIHATPTLVIQLGKRREVLEGAPSRVDLDKAIERLKETYTGSWPSPSESGSEPAADMAP